MGMYGYGAQFTLMNITKEILIQMQFFMCVRAIFTQLGINSISVTATALDIYSDRLIRCEWLRIGGIQTFFTNILCM